MDVLGDNDQPGARVLSQLVIAAFAALGGAAASSTAPADPPQAAAVFTSDEPVSVDLLRVYEQGPRIYVQAGLPDGSLGVFLVDTGADVSAISREVAERIGLIADQEVTISGLSGYADVKLGQLAELRLGDVVVDDITVAVDVPGVSTRIGGMPIAGLLGNNVWGRFTLEIDYPADLLVLHPPGSLDAPTRHTSPVALRDGHLYAPIGVRPDKGRRTTRVIEMHLDTGAGEITLCGEAGRQFQGSYTEGLEAIYGIGASETLPAWRFLHTTRRVQLHQLTLGGRRYDTKIAARWVDWDLKRGQTCTTGMTGLAGHEVMARHRVLIDMQNGWISLQPSKRKARALNGHAVLLEQDLAEHGPDDASRQLERAMLHLGLGDLDAVDGQLTAFIGHTQAVLDAGKDDPGGSARVMLARVRRSNGDFDGARAALADLDGGALVDHDEIIAAVNALIFDGDRDAALALAREATSARPDIGWPHVAYADALYAFGDLAGAAEALRVAAEQDNYPDAHQIRRARVALAGGDRSAALVALRELVDTYPMMGQFLWFYALLTESPSERADFAMALERALNKLHPWSRPLDFQVASLAVLGDAKGVKQLMKEGVRRDCKAMPAGSGRDNCLAWYWALAGVRPNKALMLVDGALADAGARADYLDTKAMVHLGRGERDLAAKAALAAARLSPDDVYMVWQAERIGALARDDDAH